MSEGVLLYAHHVICPYSSPSLEKLGPHPSIALFISHNKEKLQYQYSRCTCRNLNIFAVNIPFYVMLHS